MSVPLLVPPTIGFSDDRLANGLRVVISEDHRLPIASVTLWYDVGSRHERPGRTGFAHLFEHLMFEGSRDVERGEHATTVLALGGTYNATTAEDRTNYFQTVPSHAVELVLWLEANRLGGLLDAVTQANLDVQRDIVKNERRQNVDNTPYGLADEHLRDALFPEGHPYHHPVIGSMADLDAASLDDVHQFFRTHYAPDNAVLVLVGDVRRAEVLEWAERYFGTIPARGFPTSVAIDGSLDLGLGGEVRETIPRDSVTVPAVIAGYRSPPFGTPDYDALTLACAVLSTGRASRLYRRLQVDNQLASQASIGPSGNIGGISRTMAIAVPTHGVTIDQVESALHAAVASLLDEPPTDHELSRARIMLESARIASFQGPQPRADALAAGALYFDDPDHANSHFDRLNSVKVGDLCAVAENVFHPDNRVVLRFIPEELR